jgi:hypothetical protein
MAKRPTRSYSRARSRQKTGEGTTPEASLEDRVQLLSARIEVIMKFVEMLVVEHLEKDPDPRLIADGIAEDIFNAEKGQRQQFGENYYSLQIAETASALLDRAVARAVASQKSKGGGT